MQSQLNSTVNFELKILRFGVEKRFLKLTPIQIKKNISNIFLWIFLCFGKSKYFELSFYIKNLILNL